MLFAPRITDAKPINIITRIKIVSSTTSIGVGHIRSQITYLEVAIKSNSPLSTGDLWDGD